MHWQGQHILNASHNMNRRSQPLLYMASTLAMVVLDTNYSLNS